MQFFFSGFVTTCAIVYVLNKERLLRLLPLSYAFTALLYLGWLLKSLYPDYSFDNISASFQQPYLKIFALSALLFWIPALRKLWLALLHSGVFFALIIYDLTLDHDKLMNGIKIYLGSVVLHIVAFLVVWVLQAAFKSIRRRSLITLTGNND